MKEKYAIGMVFGVFDGLHQGHRHFLTQAAKQCEKLVVVVAHPTIVQTLKQREPHHALPERIASICAFNSHFEVVSGDTEIGTWSALKKYQPDSVLLGYDQERLGQELTKLGVASSFVTAHQPEIYKSSLLNNNAHSTS